MGLLMTSACTNESFVLCRNLPNSLRIIFERFGEIIGAVTTDVTDDQAFEMTMELT